MVMREAEMSIHIPITARVPVRLAREKSRAHPPFLIEAR
jgi:hypothetical protein